MVNCDTLEKHGGTCFHVFFLSNNQKTFLPLSYFLENERESWENRDGLGRAKLVQSYHKSRSCQFRFALIFVKIFCLV